VISVNDSALDIMVKKTSDPATVPKRRTRIGKELVTSLFVREKRSIRGRAILTPLIGIGGAAGAVGLLSLEILAGDESAEKVFLVGVTAAAVVIGHRIGSRLDHRWIEIRLSDPLPGAPAS
jgi:hypothetical protein